MKITDGHRQKAFADYEGRGIYQVKEFLARGAYTNMPHIAVLAREWLAEKQAGLEAPEKEKELAIAREANDISREANKIAKGANIFSLWAIILSVIATAAAVIALFK